MKARNGPAGSPTELPARWNAEEKIDLVLRLLRGEDVRAVLHEKSVPEHELMRWYQRFLEGGKRELREREPFHLKIAEVEKRTEEFSRLLDRRQHTPQHEQAIQRFLEDYPFFLPGLWDQHGGPASGMVITKPDLGDFIPDFAFVSQTTASYQFTLIEIEDPCKAVFTKSDTFTTPFRVAQQQVKDWVGAFDQLKDRLLAVFADAMTTYAEWKYKYCKAYLIYGRRAEVEKSRRRRERWSAETRHFGPGVPVEVMTYDRLLTPLGVVLEMRGHTELLRTARYVDRMLRERD